MPAAGPLIARKDPLILETNKPPMMAVIMPARIGKFEALAIAKQRGRAIKETDKPETTFCLRLMLDILMKKTNNLINKNTHTNCKTNSNNNGDFHSERRFTETGAIVDLLNRR